MCNRRTRDFPTKILFSLLRDPTEVSYICQYVCKVLSINDLARVESFAPESCSPPFPPPVGDFPARLTVHMLPLLFLTAGLYNSLDRQTLTGFEPYRTLVASQALVWLASKKITLIRKALSKRLTGLNIAQWLADHATRIG